MFNKNSLCYYKFFNCLCSHKDTIVLHCMDDILMDFWVGLKFHAIRIRGIESFYLFKGIKRL